MTAPAEAPIALVFPPLWDTIESPPLGPAILAGALRATGRSAATTDLNLDFHDWLFADETLDGLLRSGAGAAGSEELEWTERLRREDPRRRSLVPERWAPLFLLASSLGMQARPLLGPQRHIVGIPSSRVTLRDLVDLGAEDPVAAFWTRWMGDHTARLTGPRPRLVAITVSHVCQLLPAIVLAKTLRQSLSPPPPILAGGPWFTFMAVTGVDLGPLFEVFDAIGVGPGEDVLVRAAESAPGLPDAGPGLWLEGRAPPDLGRPEPASPDFSSFELERYFADGQPRYPLETSRGCWGRCRFCNASSLNRGYLTKPLDQMIAEVEHVQDLDPGARITFVDTVIAPKRALALAEAIADLSSTRGHRIEWRFCLRPDARLDPEQCAQLADSGVYWVFIGIDAPAQRLLDEIDKRAVLDNVRSLVASLQAAQIEIGANFILGLPGETEADRQAILDLVQELSLTESEVTTSLFGLTRGSWYYEHRREMGWPEGWLERVEANDVLTDFRPAPAVDPSRRTAPGGRPARVTRD